MPFLAWLLAFSKLHACLPVTSSFSWDPELRGWGQGRQLEAGQWEAGMTGGAGSGGGFAWGILLPSLPPPHLCNSHNLFPASPSSFTPTSPSLPTLLYTSYMQPPCFVATTIMPKHHLTPSPCWRVNACALGACATRRMTVFCSGIKTMAFSPTNGR